MEREPCHVAPSQPLPRRLGLLSKVLLLTLPIVVVLGGLVGFTTREAERIRLDLDRVLEEQRELELATSLASELIGAKAWAELPASETRRREAVVQDLVGHLTRARAIVADLARGPLESDPSAAWHERRERQLIAQLDRTLADSARRASTQTDWTAVSAQIREAQRSAEVLEAESKEEALEAATDLAHRVSRLVHIHYGVAIVCLVTMLLLGLAFRNLILRPVRLLQQAAVELGSSGQRKPVPVLSRDEFGQLTHAFNDMAERLESYHEHLEARVRERTRDLIRTARLADLGTIAAGIAHEINNPLASISAGVEGLQRDLRNSEAVSPDTMRYIDLVVEEAYRAKEIASRLLWFGRQGERTLQAVWLEQEARDVVSMLAFEAKQRGVHIVTPEPGGLPPIQGDPGEWRQVFFNLLRNALDAAPGNSEVRVEMEHRDGTLSVSVQDAGAGFDPAVLDSVFEPFMTTKPPGSGTGLGLAIVEQIVRNHGGHVTARNLEPGAEIRIELSAPG